MSYNFDVPAIKRTLLDDYTRQGGKNAADFILGMTWFEEVISDCLNDNTCLNDFVPANVRLAALHKELVTALQKITEQEASINSLTAKLRVYKKLHKDERKKLKKESMIGEMQSEMYRIRQDRDRLLSQVMTSKVSPHDSLLS